MLCVQGVARTLAFQLQVNNVLLVSATAAGVCMQALPSTAGCKPVRDDNLRALMAAAFPGDVGLWASVAACICPQKLQEHAHLVSSLVQSARPDWHAKADWHPRADW